MRSYQAKCYCSYRLSRLQNRSKIKDNGKVTNTHLRHTSGSFYVTIQDKDFVVDLFKQLEDVVQLKNAMTCLETRWKQYCLQCGKITRYIAGSNNAAIATISAVISNASKGYWGDGDFLPSGTAII